MALAALDAFGDNWHEISGRPAHAVAAFATRFAMFTITIRTNTSGIGIGTATAFYTGTVIPSPASSISVPTATLKVTPYGGPRSLFNGPQHSPAGAQVQAPDWLAGPPSSTDGTPHYRADFDTQSARLALAPVNAPVE